MAVQLIRLFVQSFHTPEQYVNVGDGLALGNIIRLSYYKPYLVQQRLADPVR